MIAEVKGFDYADGRFGEWELRIWAGELYDFGKGGGGFGNWGLSGLAKWARNMGSKD
ncbi:MAG: hypothetical protein LBH04_01200 [Tannerellaceae bacterium]|jgi:hypothetical protein|nr:hypothetical protein [Tannerellaceae bacterium]